MSANCFDAILWTYFVSFLLVEEKVSGRSSQILEASYEFTVNIMIPLATQTGLF